MSSIPLRPDAGGSKGRSITVKTNFFPVTALADVPVYHYDVCITPELPPANSRRVWAQVELLLPKDTFLAFDGMKNAFGPRDIPDQTYAVHILKHEVSVLPQVERVAPQRGGRGGARGGRGASSADRAKPPTMVWAPAAKCGPQTKLCDSEKFSVVVRKVNTVSFHELLLFAQGKGKETDNVLHCSNVLSIVLRHVPSMLFTPVGQNFFTPEGRIPMMGGLEIWRGYHQSVKALMAGHLGINIDLASCVFRKGGISALDYLCEVFGVRDNEQLLKMPRINQRINEELKGVSVITNHRADARHRFKVARISTDTANSYKFTPEEGKGEINITQYFKTNYKINLKYPNLPIVWKANGKTF
jgi:eukaryotic translation initiation factor 2C